MDKPIYICTERVQLFSFFSKSSATLISCLFENSSQSHKCEVTFCYGLDLNFSDGW